MNGPICLCSAIMGVCMGFRVSEKSKGEQTCNQNFLILSLLYSSPVSPSLYSHCIFYLSAPPLLLFPSPPLCTSLTSAYSLSFGTQTPELTLSDHFCLILSRKGWSILSYFSLTFITCFQLQVNAWNGHPGCHGNKNCLDQRSVLPDVWQQLVKTVNIQCLNHQGGNIDSFAAGHVVTQRHIVGAAVITLHLWQRKTGETFKLQPCFYCTYICIWSEAV